MVSVGRAAFSGSSAGPSFLAGRWIAIAFVLISCPVAVTAQEIEAWFANSEESRVYVSIQQDLITLSQLARIELLSDAPLAVRLKEGASKNIAPARLEAALRTELESLSEASALIRAKGLALTDRTAAADVFSRLDLAMRAGCGIDDLSAALDGAIARQGRKSTALLRAVAALDAVVGLPLDPSQRLALVTALASGSGDIQRFAEIHDNWAYLVFRNGGTAGAIHNLGDETASPAGGGTVPPGAGGGIDRSPPSQGGQRATQPSDGPGGAPRREAGPASHPGS